jgi:hypothetical protein
MSLPQPKSRNLKFWVTKSVYVSHAGCKSECLPLAVRSPVLLQRLWSNIGGIEVCTLLDSVDAVLEAELVVLQVADDRVSGLFEFSSVQSLLTVGVERVIGGGNGLGDNLLDERSRINFQRCSGLCKLSCLVLRVTIDSANLVDYTVTNVVRITVAGMGVEQKISATILVVLAIVPCNLGDLVGLVSQISVERGTLAERTGMETLFLARLRGLAENSSW